MLGGVSAELETQDSQSYRDLNRFFKTVVPDGNGSPVKPRLGVFGHLNPDPIALTLALRIGMNGDLRAGGISPTRHVNGEQRTLHHGFSLDQTLVPRHAIHCAPR